MNPLERRVRDGWLRQANVPAEGYTLAQLDTPEEVQEWTAAYCRGVISNGLGLALYGAPGHGKTTMAEAICRHVIEHADLSVLGFTPELKVVRPVYFTAYYDHIEMQKKQWRLEKANAYESEEYGDVLDALEGVSGSTRYPEHHNRLVVLDDVGKEYHSGSGWAEGELNALLRTRWRRNLSTIITTNVPVELWDVVYGKAAASFVHEAFVPVEILNPSGTDRRR